MEFNPDNSFFDDLALAGVSTEIPASLKRKESFDSVPLAKRAATESFNLGNAVDDVEMFAHPVPETFCLLYTSPSPRDLSTSRMPSSA